MAYNPYFPMNYQQNYYPAFPQQTPQNYQPQQSYQPQQTSIIWVSGEKEAQMYPVAPNNAVTLWSQSEPVVYLKQADATGKPSLRVYDLVERAESANTGVSSADGKSITYATKDELSAVVGAVKGFDDSIGSIKSEIEQMKSDLYGIAGKKKKVKEDE